MEIPDLIRVIRGIRGEIEITTMHELIHKELSQSIIGAAMTVLNVLKPGLSEKIYENALTIELEKRGHKVEQQRQYPVYYDGKLVGNLIPDLIIDDKVIADPRWLRVSMTLTKPK